MLCAMAVSFIAGVGYLPLLPAWKVAMPDIQPVSFVAEALLRASASN